MGSWCLCVPGGASKRRQSFRLFPQTRAPHHDKKASILVVLEGPAKMIIFAILYKYSQQSLKNMFKNSPVYLAQVGLPTPGAWNALKTAAEKLSSI